MLSSAPTSPAHRHALIAQARQTLLADGAAPLRAAVEPWIAQSWQRYLAQGMDPAQRVVGEAGSAPALRHSLEQSHALHDKVLGLGEQQLLEPVDYTNLKGDPFTQPRWQLLMHCFNHATYHRGQLVSIMHQLELDEVPNTDMVNYQRLLRAGA